MTRGLSLTFHYVHIARHLFPFQYIPFFLFLFLRINLSWHRGNTRNESRWTCIEFPAINCIVTNCERLFVTCDRITSTVVETLVLDYDHNEECTTMYSSKSMWLNSYVLTKGRVIFLKRVKEIAKQRKKNKYTLEYTYRVHDAYFSYLNSILQWYVIVGMLCVILLQSTIS